MIRSDSYVIRKEACPACRRLGNDRSGDNLAVYSDNHSYCFKCGYHTGRRKIATRIEKPEQQLALPEDVTTELPFEARAWLGQYSLARLDVQQHHIMWSDRMSRIIFPYFDSTGLIAWQGRYVGNDKSKAKWFSQGKIHEIIHPIKVNEGKAVLVEDIVSAIKVSHFTGTIPIFGSSISTTQIIRLKHVVDTVFLWLDPDMRKKSVKFANSFRSFGVKAYTIFSDKDPKEHSNEEILEILEKHK